jgi:uncharacterized protein YjbJ (UPF0337 family)
VGDKLDDLKGRAKKAAGTATGDKDLEREGKLDQAGAAIKEKIGDAKEKADDVVDKVKEKFSDDK